MEYKVLVVDDIDKNLQLVGNLLQGKGINILLANNGKKAIAAAKKKLPDLILLDINMPEMDGYEVCHQLKGTETTRKIPIIFLTANTETEDVVKGFAYGAVDYVTKPFKKEELISRVLTHLELKKSKDIIDDQNQQLELINAKIIEHSRQVESLNKQLNSQNRELKEANATKDKFFSIVSHDLRSPFSSIMGFSSLLIESIENFDKEKLQSFAVHLRETTDNTYKLLENLLSWAKTQTGKLTFTPEKLDLYNLISDNTKLLSKVASDKSISLHTQDVDEVFAIADCDMMNTVIRNLVSNAIKFTQQGGAIYIACKYVPDSEQVKITVKDTGIGMDNETQEKLFDLSVHHTSRGTNDEPGTGLGLILCKEFLEINKGTIHVSSEINQGSTFYFTLPRFTK